MRQESSLLTVSFLSLPKTLVQLSGCLLLPKIEILLVHAEKLHPPKQLCDGVRSAGHHILPTGLAVLIEESIVSNIFDSV